MLLGLQNVTFEFGARTIVEDATWHIQPNERIGLIGYNGTGKSTLLKVLTGQYTPSKGSVEKGRETTIGFLHQDLLGFDTEDSILEVAMGAFERVKQLEKEIEILGKNWPKPGMKNLPRNILICCMKWMYWMDIVFITARKKFCRDWVSAMPT
jgi:ATP-binding cassette subfamily F protein 3